MVLLMLTVACMVQAKQGTSEPNALDALALYAAVLSKYPRMLANYAVATYDQLVTKFRENADVVLQVLSDADRFLDRRTHAGDGDDHELSEDVMLYPDGMRSPEPSHMMTAMHLSAAVMRKPSSGAGGGSGGGSASSIDSDNEARLAWYAHHGEVLVSLIEQACYEGLIDAAFHGIQVLCHVYNRMPHSLTSRPSVLLAIKNLLYHFQKQFKLALFRSAEHDDFYRIVRVDRRTSRK
jgi:hypothetical protein